MASIQPYFLCPVRSRRRRSSSHQRLSGARHCFRLLSPRPRRLERVRAQSRLATSRRKKRAVTCRSPPAFADASAFAKAPADAPELCGGGRRGKPAQRHQSSLDSDRPVASHGSRTQDRDSASAYSISSRVNASSGSTKYSISRSSSSSSGVGGGGGGGSSAGIRTCR